MEQFPSGQVEPFHRLVQHEQIGFGEYGLGQSEALNHSLAVVGDRFPGTVGQSDLFEQRGHADSQTEGESPPGCRRTRAELEALK